MTEPTPLDSVEQRHAMRGLAETLWAFYDALRHQGFGRRREALDLTRTWLIEISRGAQSR